MKNLNRLSTLAFGVLFLTAAAEVPAPREIKLTHPKSAIYRADQVIVKMKTPSTMTVQKMGIEKARSSSFEKAARDSSLVFKSTFQAAGESDEPMGLMAVDESTDSVEQAIARLQSNPDVESVQPDFIYRASAVPNDTHYGKLWGLKNSAQTLTRDHSSQSLYATSNPGTAARDIGAEAAWDKITDCSTVVVAVVDTGVDLDHDDLKDNLWSNMGFNGYDFVNTDNDPSDDQGHGTHVAGTIGARGNNATGTTGVCWRVKIMAVKVLGADGSGSTAGVTSGINYAVTNGAHIINMSLGGGGYDAAMLNAINAANTAGVLVVVAAGNDAVSTNSYATYPCNYTSANILCVGAVDQGFNLASFSNFSTTHVDIGAPGTNIVSASPNTWSNVTLPLTDPAWTMPVTGTDNTSFAITASNFLQYPQNYNGANLYAANKEDTALTSFDMLGNEGAIAIINLRGNAQDGFDGLNIFNRSNSPSVFGSTYSLGAITGSIPNFSNVVVNLTACKAGTTNCYLGFRFESDATVENTGYQIQRIIIDYKVPSTSGRDQMNGTSMATPHVAGLAALVKAYNPTFQAIEMKNAILNTGTKVTNLTSVFGRGSVINAPNALKYVDPPRTITFAIAP